MNAIALAFFIGSPFRALLAFNAAHNCNSILPRGASQQSLASNVHRPTQKAEVISFAGSSHHGKKISACWAFYKKDFLNASHKLFHTIKLDYSHVGWLQA